jgi:hypothetical protein
MTGLALKLFFGGLLKRIGAFLADAFRWILAHPWQAAVIALCAFSAWLWWHDSRIIAAKDRTIAAHERVIEAMKAESLANLAAQWAQKRAVEQRYKDLADDNDERHEKELVSVRSAADRYIAAHRLRAENGSSSSQAGSPAENLDPEIPGSVPGDPDMVAVSTDDLHRCSAAWQYAVDAHVWAMELKAASEQPVTE